MFCCMFCCAFFVISKGRASLRPSGDKKKRGKMNWWVEKNRSKTGKSGLKKMAKNGQKWPKIAKNCQKNAKNY